MTEIVLLSEQNFTECSLDSFERRQDVRRVYRRGGTGYELCEHSYREDWSLKEKRELAAEISGNDYITYLSFDGKAVCGLIALKKRLVDGWMILELMQVSAPYRRRGLGRLLFGKGMEEAGKAGAKGLYISACSSEETIAFYHAMGAVLTNRPIPEYAQKEPCDLQMVCAIR